MRIVKRLALLLGSLLSINMILPSNIMLAREVSYLSDLKISQRTTGSQIELDTTTPSVILIAGNTKFDKNSTIEQENYIEIQFKYGIPESVIMEDVELVLEQDYSIKGEVVKIEPSYLMNLLVGNHSLDFTVLSREGQNSYIFTQEIQCIDTSEIYELIGEAEGLLNDAVIGVEAGEFYLKDQLVFQDAIKDAQGKLEEVKDQDEINNIYSKLEEAIHLFKNSIIQHQDVNRDGKVDIQDLALVMYHYRSQKQDEIWDKIQNSDVNQDGVVDLTDLIEVANKILAR